MYQILRIGSQEEAVAILTESSIQESHDMGFTMVHVVKHPSHGDAVLHLPADGQPFLTKKS